MKTLVYDTQCYASVGVADEVSQAGFFEFVWLPTFERSAAALLSDADRRGIEQVLVEDPEHGTLIPGTGGFRKMRWRSGGKGKRGGVRLVYFYVPHAERLYMVLAYGKNVQDDLTMSERAALRKLAGAIKREANR